MNINNKFFLHIIFSAILLLIIFTTFCDTFSSDKVEIDEISLASIVFLGK